MFFSTIAAYLPYCLVTAYTPGLNNIICLHAVSSGGWKKGWPVVAGVLTGFFCVMVICAVFCYSLEDLILRYEKPLTFAGAAYIIWLGIHVAMSKKGENDQRQMSFLKGFLLDFVNVKIILYAITVYTLYVIPQGADLKRMLLHALSLTVIGYSGTLTWGVFGGMLQTFINRHYRPFHLVMGAVLIYCAATMCL